MKLKHEDTLLGRKARYRSPYGKSPITITISDVIYHKHCGLGIITTNGVFYKMSQIRIL